MAPASVERPDRAAFLRQVAEQIEERRMPFTIDIPSVVAGTLRVIADQIAKTDAALDVEPETFKGIALALKTYIEIHGPVHEDVDGEVCPADDTCVCPGMWINDGINRAVGLLDRLEAAS